MVPDFQRSKVLDAQSAALKRDETLISFQDVVDLVANICHDFELSPMRVEVGEPKMETTRDALVVPLWAHKQLLIVHAMAHIMTDPIFPAHGSEFCERWLGLLAEFDHNGYNALLEEFENRRVHYTPATRGDRVKRIAVNYANNSKGMEVELVVDDPPERIVGPMLAAGKDWITVGDRDIETARGRYLCAAAR